MAYARELVANFRFMVLEVIKQIEDALESLAEPDCHLAERLERRDDYIDTLRGVIESKCFTKIESADDEDSLVENQVKAINAIAGNLENIADYAANIVYQVRFLSHAEFMAEFDFQPFFAEILGSMHMIVDSLLQRDITMALHICKSEFELDDLYKTVFDEVMKRLGAGRDIEDLVTALFIFRYLERIGDALLNIGEAVIGAVVGQKLKIHQYRAIEETLEASEDLDIEGGFAFRSVPETLSGCSVGVLESRAPLRTYQGAIFKEGVSAKIVPEKKNLELWNRVAPGFAPRILGFQQRDSHAALLIEYLPGRTFQEIMVFDDDETAFGALRAITARLETLWDRTREGRQVSADYVGQLKRRLDDVLKVHPDFAGVRKEICDLEVGSLDEVLARAAEEEGRLRAPFSVLVHGDLNSDNVIYEPLTGQVHFIDLYRSSYSDYVQDVSVFIVSAFRLPIFDRHLRDRLNRIIGDAFEAFQEFAQLNGDEHFTERITLALGRSMITSTRFELKRKFSTTLFERGVYLIKKVTEPGRPTGTDFRVPIDVLIY